MHTKTANLNFEVDKQTTLVSLEAVRNMINIEINRSAK